MMWRSSSTHLQRRDSRVLSCRPSVSGCDAVDIANRVPTNLDNSFQKVAVKRKFPIIHDRGRDAVMAIDDANEDCRGLLRGDGGGNGNKMNHLAEAIHKDEYTSTALDIAR
ncbi:hypothetical protein PR003_g13487 [Phytophthora rubi]|uniref:Uncharacterized protein n=1 Tax=Phytophthora rubi TaxID=129364 RepID=A0A6A3MF55_9STRA|nr:hypothetical protein PR001_g11703 [Phytophthora rubi]KAE9334506.1 hypothetical protein PR003_g13487 [Phytophthora rubi]